MSRVNQYLGLSDAEPRVIGLARKYAGFVILIQATTAISTTYFLIFVAEALGNGDFLAGMAVIGVLVVVQMTVQTLFDYPTGVIGDWIGQRYILATAFLTYSMAFYLVSIVTFSTPLAIFVLIYALMGFASSQQSGALGSWFDNNWKAAMPEDEGAEQYGVFSGKIGMMIWLTNVLILIPGGFLAIILGRAWVFQLQSVLCLIIAIFTFIFVRNLPATTETISPSRSMEEYFALLKGGISFLFSDRNVAYFLIGTMLITSCIAVWANLILFPMYYSYMISDVAVASFRTIVMIPLVFYSERSGVWAKRFKPKKWIPRFSFIQTCGAIFFWTFALLLFVFQPPSIDSPMVNFVLPFTEILLLRVPLDSLLPVAIMIIMFYLGGVFLQVGGVLRARMFIQIIPNKNRNGVYSLFPTIVLILTIPQISFFGWIISYVGIPFALIILGFISSIGVLMVQRALSKVESGAIAEEESHRE